MKNLITHLKMLAAMLFLSLLVACGGGSDEEPANNDPVSDETEDEEEEDAPAVAEPVVSTLLFGDGSLTIAFTHELELEDDPVDVVYDLYYAQELIEIDEDEDGNVAEEDLSLEGLQDRIDGLLGGTVVEDIESPIEVTGLINDTFYYFVLTATTVADGTSDPSDELRATPRDYSVGSVVPYVLNDTGRISCGDYAFNIDVDGDGSFDDSIDTENSGDHNNYIDCITGGVDPDGDTVPEPTAQDAFQGRDYLAETGALTKTGAGVAGFDFTKLDASGNTLGAGASSWSCVRDNHTGLEWEVKTESGLHNGADLYTWYNPEELINGGFAGYTRATQASSASSNDTCDSYDGDVSSSYCNTEAFVERVNAAGLCGSSDWRLPTREELVGIVDYEPSNEDGASPEHYPSLDQDYFLNIQVTTVSGIDITAGQVRYFTNTPLASNALGVWGVYLGAGGAASLNKGAPNAVMLVRADP